MNLIIFFLGIVIISLTIYLIYLNSNSRLIDINENQDMNTEDMPIQLLNHSDDRFSKVLLDEVKAIDSIIKNEDEKELNVEYNLSKKESYNNNNFIRKVEKNDSNINETENSYGLAFKISKLTSEGLNSQEIAKKLGKGVREIDTIIRINKLKSNAKD